MNIRIHGSMIVTQTSILLLAGLLFVDHTQAFNIGLGIPFLTRDSEKKSEVPVPEKNDKDQNKPEGSFLLSFLPSFPALPQLPAIPSFEKETITATRTLYIEVTSRQTRHPVCYTAYGIKPPCLPYSNQGQINGNGAYSGGFNGAFGHHGKVSSPLDDDLPEGLYIQPTASGSVIEPTSSYLVEDDQLASSRDAKYLRFGVKPKKEGNTQETVSLESSTDDLEARHPFKETEVITKTLHVTKVQKYTDYRVTATLIAQNCIPYESRIPLCAGKKPVNPIYVKPIHKPHYPPRPYSADVVEAVKNIANVSQDDLVNQASEVKPVVEEPEENVKSGLEESQLVEEDSSEEETGK